MPVKKITTKRTVDSVARKKKPAVLTSQKKKIILNKKSVRLKRVKNNFKRLKGGKKLTGLFGSRLAFSVAVFVVAVFSVTGWLIWQGKDQKVLGASESVKKIIPEYYTQALMVGLGTKTLTVTPVSGNKIKVDNQGIQYIYREAYKNTDVVQTSYAHKIKEEMKFSRTGHPTVFKYKLGNIESYVVEKDQEGNILFFDYDESEGGGKTILDRVFTIFAPFVQDQKSRSFTAVTAEIEGDELVVTIDKDWLKTAEYPVTLDPTVEINVLNIQSYPMVGGEWKIDFTTEGEANLQISGLVHDDYHTVFDEDIEMASLACGDFRFEILDFRLEDSYLINNFNCDGTASLVLKVLKPGKHHIQFDFGGEIADAYNDASSEDSWWDLNYANRRAITINNATSTSALTNFPVLVRIMQKDVVRIDYAKTQDLGQDIRFVNYDGTALDYEIEKWDETATSTVWVEIPSVEGSTTTQYFYMYYNYPGASSAATTTGVWDDNFVQVQHMDDIYDSTKSYNHGNNSGAATTTSGVYGNAFDFVGTESDYISVAGGGGLNNQQSGTIEMWVRWSGTQDGGYQNNTYGQVLARQGNAQFSNNIIGLSTSDPAAGKIIWNPYSWSGRAITSATSPGNGVWRHLVITFSSGSHVLYLDGVSDGSSATTGSIYNNATIPLTIGAWIGDGAGYSTSRIDEVRISNTVRSANWVKADYESLTDDYLNYGIEETVANPSPDIKNIKGRLNSGVLKIQGGVMKINLDTDREKTVAMVQ